MPFNIFGNRVSNTRVRNGQGRWRATSIARNPAISPLDFTGLDLWMDSADDSSYSTSGTEITAWTDKSTNGFVFSQATPSKRPDLDTAAVNGLNGIRFTRADSQILTSASAITSATEGELFVAYTLDSNPGSGDFYSQLCISPNDNFDQLTWALRNDGAGPALSISNDPASLGVGVVRGPTGAFTTGDANVHIVNYRSDSAAWSITSDRSDLALTVISGSNTGLWTADTTRTQIAIGGFTGSSETHYFNGLILEILLYTREFTAVERGVITDYLAVKWGF